MKGKHRVQYHETPGRKGVVIKIHATRRLSSEKTWDGHDFLLSLPIDGAYDLSY